MISLTMPSDVRTIVLEYQGKKKASTGLGHYSQQHCIISIIREYKDQKERLEKIENRMGIEPPEES